MATRAELRSDAVGSAKQASARDQKLTVAITGPSGTFGLGLMPLLEADDRVGRVVGVARRPFDPGAHGWSKMTYRRGDVRDPDVLAEAFAGADVVVHLAFMITGSASRQAIREINVHGTLNVFRAAAAAGADRFVYASSAAAYGFHRDNPVGMTEEWPARPASRLFYAQEKAELEQLLGAAAAEDPALGLYLLRPPVVLGPNALGAKELPGLVAALGRAMGSALHHLPVPFPVPTPNVPLQLIHSDDVAEAFRLCIAAAGPPGIYNIAADGVVTGADIARELGLTPVPISGRVTHMVARGLTALPGGSLLPATTDWVEALSHPSIMDPTKATEALGWQPRFSALETLRATLSDDRR